MVGRYLNLGEIPSSLRKLVRIAIISLTMQAKFPGLAIHALSNKIISASTLLTKFLFGSMASESTVYESISLKNQILQI